MMTSTKLAIARLRAIAKGPGLRLLAASLVAGLLATSPSMAAKKKETVVGPKDPPISMELNEGRMIRLEDPAASVFIANPAVADVSVKSQRLIYLFGTKPGETTLFAVDEEDEVIASMDVRVTHNMSALNDNLDQVLPDSDIKAISLDGGILLTGEVSNASQAENVRRIAGRFLGENEELINQLSVTSPNQINLQVRIAEVSRQVINQFGINWDAAFIGSTDFLFGIATGSPITPSSLAGAFTVSPAFGTPAISDPNGTGAGNFLTRGGGTDSFFFRSTKGNFDVNTLVDLLANDGLVTVLAEPNLTALAGETASFLAGGEFPIPIAQDGNSISVEFKKFGVSLAFTPTIVGGDRISMRVAPEVSQLTNAGAITLQNIQIPALTTRRAETTVELGSGQSFAIAGLLLDNTQHDYDSIPGLSDLPILGPLFDSERFERSESELVIIVTPYLVKPARNPEALASPTDPYVITAKPASPDDLSDLRSLPRTIPLDPNGSSSGNQAQPSGFIVE